MNIRRVLEELVEIAVSTRKMDKAFLDAGYDNTPYFDIYAGAMEAVYHLLGEETETIDESVTYEAINNDSYTNDERVDLLMEEYERNVTE